MLELQAYFIFKNIKQVWTLNALTKCNDDLACLMRK